VILTAIRRLAAAVAESLRPVVRTPIADWIQRHVRLSDLEAARGPFDIDDGRPWWREILEAAADPTTRTISLVASTQVGKTLALCALILYLVRHAPASALVVLPDKPATTEFRDRLYALAQESGLSVPAEWRWNLRYCDIGGMRIYLAWSGSKQGLRGRRCKYVFLSEIDVYQPANKAGDPIEASKQRVKAFPLSLIFAESSPVPEPSRIDQLEAGSDRRRWYARCPHCGRAQEIRFFVHRDGPHKGCGGFGGLKDRHGNYVDPDEARKAAHYLCEAGCKITGEEKQAFITAGRWVPAGCSIDPATGELVGEPARGARDVGFRLWAVHSNATWGDIAAEYLVQRANGTLPDYFQNWLGLSYKNRGSMPTWQELGRRLALPAHFRGNVPSDAWFLTATADVQGDEVYAVVRAWGDKKTSWLVDWWVLDRERGDEADLVKSDLAQLDAAVMEAWFPVAGRNPRGRKRLQVALLGIDGKYRTLEVHQWKRSHEGSPRIRVVQGDGTMPLQVRYKNNVVYESRRTNSEGKKVEYEGGLELWSINSNVYRRELSEKFHAAPDRPGAWLLPEGIVDVGQHYLKQLVNEPPVMERNKKDGRQRLVYRERDKTLGHDFWDCEVNDYCVADMLVDQLPKNPGWDASKWPRPAETGRRRPRARVEPENRSAR
jgi:phage terminase large subunit GpA-like protein